MLFRVVFFNLVWVNPDTGLYLYDAKLLLEGKMSYFNRFSRSPLFHIFLSPAILLEFSPIFTARIQMILISMALGVTIYFATTRLHSRKAGIISMAVFLLAPFELVWGLWVKTEQVAQLLFLVGSLPLLGHLDSDRIPPRDLILLGGAVGAAFFVRRVVIVHFGVILLFLFYYRYRIRQKPLIDPVSRGALFSISAGLTLLIGYLVWSGVSAESFFTLVNTHLTVLASEPVSAADNTTQATGIIESSVSFAYGLAVTNYNHLRIYLRAAIVLLPVLLILSTFPTILIKRKIGNKTTFIVFVAIAIGAVVATFLPYLTTFTKPVVVAVGLGLAATLLTLQNSEMHNISSLDAKLLLPAILALALIFSYAVRDRGMFVTYFQDVFPYLAIVSGAVAVVFWQEIQFKLHKPVWGSLLIIAAVVSFTLAFPLAVAPAAPAGDTLTPTDAVTVGNSLNQGFGDDAQGFSTQPLYMLEAGHKVANDFSRRMWTVRRDPSSERSRQIINETAAELSSGETEYIITDRNRRIEYVLIGQINKTYRQEYCLAELNNGNSDIDRQTNIKLYKYCSS